MRVHVLFKTSSSVNDGLQQTTLKRQNNDDVKQTSWCTSPNADQQSSAIRTGTGICTGRTGDLISL